MIEWGRVPWPLWALSASILFGVGLVEVKVHGPIAARVLYLFIVAGWLYFLLKGLRWVWIVTIGLYVLTYIPDLISGSIGWRSLAVNLIGLVLLLLPATRRYFSRGAVAAGAEGY